MWKDASLYADDKTEGVVREAYLVGDDNNRKAVVVIEA
jgi:hypothetical protein